MVRLGGSECSVELRETADLNAADHVSWCHLAFAKLLKVALGKIMLASCLLRPCLWLRFK